MGFRGDAVIVQTQELESLLLLQEQELELDKLRIAMTELASGKALEDLRDEILRVAAEITALRSEVEELERDQRRALEDLKLVQDRISRDKDRLTKTAVSRDALGIQHELETLNKRKSELEDAELEILANLEDKNKGLSKLLESKQLLETNFQNQKSQMQQQLENQKRDFRELQEHISKAKQSLPEGLVDLYLAKRKRGVAVGRMLRNTCGACNMGLTASAAHEILSKPSDELVTCPECGAVLVRN